MPGACQGMRGSHAPVSHVLYLGRWGYRKREWDSTPKVSADVSKSSHRSSASACLTCGARILHPAEIARCGCMLCPSAREEFSNVPGYPYNPCSFNVSPAKTRACHGSQIANSVKRPRQGGAKVSSGLADDEIEMKRTESDVRVAKVEEGNYKCPFWESPPAAFFNT